MMPNHLITDLMKTTMTIRINTIKSITNMNRKFANYIIKAIRFYQRIAPSWMRKMCRYNPSCSQYAIIALREKGALKGSLLAAARIIRCIPPFGGEDWPDKHDHKCHAYKESSN